MKNAHRWLMGFAGLLWLVIGMSFFIWPAATFLATTSAAAIIISIALIALGIFEVAAYFSMPKGIKRGWTLAGGIAAILLGILIIWKPAAFMVSIPLMLAFVLIFRGVIEIAGSIQGKALGLKNWWAVFISGVLALLLALFLLWSPFQTAVIYFGVSFVMYGVSEIMGAVLAKDPETLM